MGPVPGTVRILPEGRTDSHLDAWLPGGLLFEISYLRLKRQRRADLAGPTALAQELR